MIHSDLRREKLLELSAAPAKDVITNKARVCSPLHAICEIVDNIFDNYEENLRREDLAITVAVRTGAVGEISIVENSGGIRGSKLEPLVRLGLPYHGAPGSIGTWGEGFKVAAFSLGSEIEIFTYFPNERPVVVHFGEDWLNSADWTVPVYSISNGIVSSGSTLFRVAHLNREINWAEIIKELPIIYGHKIQRIIEHGKRVRIAFDIDGRRSTLEPRPLARGIELRSWMAFPPDFAPREYTTTWRTEKGSVDCRLIVALTPRHSGETSGVYLYGNGRMFARALRTREVGYGDGGNAMLRDHPSCWRIHAYGFFEADSGADIPWQAPLKDGLSGNHIITSKFREMFKRVASPYSRFAKVAKASELVPYTVEWSGMAVEQQAEISFKSTSTKSLNVFRGLPRVIRNFSPPKKLEVVRIDQPEGEDLVNALDEKAKYLRQLISNTIVEEPLRQIEVLRNMNPKAFSRRCNSSKRPVLSRVARAKTRVVVEVEPARLKKLKEHFDLLTDAEAVCAAIKLALSGSDRRRNRK